MKQEVKDIIFGDDLKKKRALFAFTIEDDDLLIRKKFMMWCRYFQPQYFKKKESSFHKDIDLYNIKSYKGEIKSFTDIVFRGGAKTSLTKLFIAFAIANDLGHFRKYIKVLCYDGNNAKQITTDIYNIFVQPNVIKHYPEIFKRSALKREETMGGFTTGTGVKLISGTVGTDQRGALQDSARPDWIYFDDFENRTTIRSAVKTIAIWDNMEEARTSLSDDGSCIYCCNYISESGNVHKLVTKENDKNIVLRIPIIDKDGVIAWTDKYTQGDIEQMKKDDEDFEGERLCEPSAGADIYFDRPTLDRMEAILPIVEKSQFKIFKNYNPSHRYGSGHDVAKGVGLDSSASVFIDFSVIPAQVVGTFANNLIKPDIFGDEVYREQNLFDGSIAGVENNYGDSCILRLKQLGANLYKTKKDNKKIAGQKTTEYGWNTNALTKGNMLSDLSSAIEDGLLILNDKALIAELKSYTRNDLIETVKDPRLTTRHFDLLIACAIAWQMKDYAEKKKQGDDYKTQEWENNWN